ncbi:MAG: acetyl-CoA carboxylase biotin carboxyl carrier protein subunit [Saprospiraceae bacterium]
MKYNVIVDEQEFALNKSDATNLNTVELNNGQLHILKDNQAYHCELLEADYNNSTTTVLVNGTKYKLKIEDEYDLLVKKMGLSIATSSKLDNIKAPMPGLVLDIMIEVGQTIEKGTPLLILEAMKMENVLKADGEGVVKSIEITKGQAVDKGQIMIEME